MKSFRILVEIVPRVLILSILVPILLEIVNRMPLILSLPQLLTEGRIDMASLPILLIITLTTCITALILPHPSLYALTIFFISLTTPLLPSPRGDLFASIGPFQVLAILFVFLVSDVVKNHYNRKVVAKPVISYDCKKKDIISGSFLFLIAIIAIPGLVSAYIASYIFLFKFKSSSPYLSPILSFLNNNPVGSILLASILLGAFYVLARQAIEAMISYMISSPKIVLTDLSRSIEVRWIRPPLGSMRGFILSAVIAPPIYYMIVKVLRIAEPTQSMQEDLYLRMALWVIGILIFIAIWSIFSKSVFSEEREPTLRGIAILIITIASIYVASYIVNTSPGFPGSSSLDDMLNPLVTYYRDAWIVAELVMRAIGAAP